ncbi:hypothetical protein, variant 2, partial [Aphanomyces invadans]
MFTRFRFSQSAVHPPECRQRSSSMPPTSGAERTAKRKEVDEEAPTDATLNLAKKSKHATRVLPRKWQERYRSICDDCFGLVQECTHFPEVPLRLLIVGHNPSDHAWQSGFSYSNPTNRLWKLLAGEYYKTVWKGVLPKDWTMSDQNKMPHALGIGFSDLGIEPGNDASKYDRKTMTKWKHDFYARMRQHLRRVAATLHENDASASMAMKCSNAYQHGPLLVAFSGKRQFTYLFDPPAKHVRRMYDVSSMCNSVVSRFQTGSKSMLHCHPTGHCLHHVKCGCCQAPVAARQ